MALLTTCQASFQSMKDYEDVKDDVESLKENVRECYSEFSIPSGKRILRNPNWKQSRKTFRQALHKTVQKSEWTSQR